LKQQGNPLIFFYFLLCKNNLKLRNVNLYLKAQVKKLNIEVFSYKQVKMTL